MANRMAEPEPELESVVAALKRFLMAFSGQVAEMVIRLNLTMPQARALHTIKRLGRVSGRQLARELKVSPASVVPLCDRLEEKGYLERVRDTDDRRLCWFQLTQAGADAFKHIPEIRPRILPVIANVSPSDRECLVRLLDGLTAAIDIEESALDMS